MKKVVSIVLNDFRNDSRVLKECFSLHQAGYEIHVAALHEEGLAEQETIDGIRVVRFRLATRGWSKFRAVQAIKYVEFMLRFLKHYRHMDYIHCNDLEPLFIALLMRGLTLGRIKIVYDAHEFETEKTGMHGWRQKAARHLERMLIVYVQSVITVSEGIALEYMKRYRIPKPRLVMNCPVFTEVAKTDYFREAFGISAATKIFLYQGGLYRGSGLELLIEAFKEPPRDDVALVIMGYGDLLDEVITKLTPIAGIHFHEAVPPHVLLNYTASADIGVSFIENTSLNNYYCVPNKFFEYAMAGLPILASPSHELERLVRTWECGRIVENYSVQALREAIGAILEADLTGMSANARAMAGHYNWQEQELALLDVYREIGGSGNENMPSHVSSSV